jgi:hypothetical protein
LRAGHEIATAQDERDRLFLHRRGLGVTEFRDGRGKRRDQSELFKSLRNSLEL